MCASSNGQEIGASRQQVLGGRGKGKTETRSTQQIAGQTRGVEKADAGRLEEEGRGGKEEDDEGGGKERQKSGQVEIGGVAYMCARRGCKSDGQ